MNLSLTIGEEAEAKGQPDSSPNRVGTAKEMAIRHDHRRLM